MTFGTAIFLLIFGILLGSVFVFGARHWYADINKSDCTVVKTHILSCTEIERQGRHQSNYLRIDCANGERYDIHSLLSSQDLAATLQFLSDEDNVTLLIHPNGDNVLEISTEDRILLPFDKANGVMDYLNVGYLIMGCILYLFAAVSLYFVVYHINKKRRNATVNANS
jgi:hypothetical protein